MGVVALAPKLLQEPFHGRHVAAADLRPIHAVTQHRVETTVTIFLYTLKKRL